MQTLRSQAALAGLILAVLAGPVYADSVHIGGTTNITNEGGQGGAGGNAAAAAAASSNPVQVNTQVNTQVTDVTTIQGQQQGQIQGQHQGQGQGQKQQANNDGNHQSVNVDVPRQAPPAIPAALAVSSLTCYGSWSIAASTPFGGVGAGFPTKDADCERARNALIFVNLGLKDVALALLGQNADNAAAMKAAGVKYPGQAVATAEPKAEPKAEEPKAEPTNFGTRASLTIPEALIANLAAQASGAGL